MKSLRIFTLIAAMVLVAPLALGAELGVRGGRYNDAGTEFIGAELVFDLGAINVNPNIEYSLEDDATAGSANVDFTLDVARMGRLRPFIGAGVGLAYADTDFGDTTEVLGNLLGGVALDMDFLTPYAQVKYFRGLDDDANGADNDELALTVGLRF
jgi:opacity protein-like surface antigen